MTVNFAKIEDSNQANNKLPWLSSVLTKQNDPPLDLQQVIHSLPSGVIFLDSRGKVAEANQVAIDMLGEPLQGQLWLNVIKRCFRPRADDGLEVSLADGRLVKIAISALAPPGGQLIVLTDLTETRKLQHRLSHLQRLSTLGKMMATLAHQIRTPLSSALLYAENLQSPKLTVTAREQFQHKLIARLNDLEQQVNDMLLFARSGTAQAVSPLSLQQLCDDVLNRSEALLTQQQARLTVRLTHPQQMILGNQTSLVEALLNLVQNSLQAIGKGAELLLAQQADSAQLVLYFSDNGPGIAEDIQPHIFEPFFSRKAGGSGLGLAVVQAVVQSHHGQVRYLSEPASQLAVLNGACFELILPLHIPSATTTSDLQPVRVLQQEVSNV